MNIQRIIFLGVLTSILALMDLYVYQAINAAISDPGMFRMAGWAFWSFSILAFTLIVLYNYNRRISSSVFGQIGIVGVISVIYFSKLFIILFLFSDDLRRVFFWSYQQMAELGGVTVELAGNPRSAFLSQAALILSTFPIALFSYGIAIGAHNFKVVREKIILPKLPKPFNGIKIGHISDIHIGSFYSKSGFKKGVDRLLAEKPDIILFTGDLVNNRASETESYIEQLKRIQAPFGVYSILGNHDYGEYVNWPDREARKTNIENLIAIQKSLGWNILLDSNTVINKDGAEIGIIGVENWGQSSRMPKYGDMDKARNGLKKHPVNILLSHDPTHWDQKIQGQHPDIDITFSGHTHGMQFGINSKILKWSPVKYFYKHWAGLYKENNQYLYVNRGFGYLGFPGRVGMPPEITMITLVNNENEKDR